MTPPAARSKAPLADPDATDGAASAPFRASTSASRQSSPFPGKVSRPESGHSLRLPVCCLTAIDERPRIRLRATGCLRTFYGMVLLHWHRVGETKGGKV